MRPDLRLEIVEEHLDEAAFLYRRWESALRSPTVALADVACGPEELLLAQLDALAVAGAGWPRSAFSCRRCAATTRARRLRRPSSCLRGRGGDRWCSRRSRKRLPPCARRWSARFRSLGRMASARSVGLFHAPS